MVLHSVSQSRDPREFRRSDHRTDRSSLLPIDARIGHKLSENFNVSLEVSVPIIKSYPVYNFLTALRFNLTF